MSILKAIKAIVTWGWSPILITALAIVGTIYEWELWMTVTSMGLILIAGLTSLIVKSGEREMEVVSTRLRQLAGHFSRRFTGTSSLSIFAIIDNLFALDNAQLWDWARACDMVERVFTTWCDSFVDRLESDTRTGRFRVYLKSYLNELWMMNNHYFEFIEQFYEIAEKMPDIPPSTMDQYNRFAVEYNNWVADFQFNIAELRKTADTQIEPPSVKMAPELPGAQPVRSFRDEESYY